MISDSQKKLIWIICGIIVIVIIMVWFLQSKRGAPVSDQYKNPENSVSEQPELSFSPLVLENFSAGDTISMPLILQGTLPGIWFFESSFPVTILVEGDDDSDIVLAETIAEAQDEWMTEKPVRFVASFPSFSWKAGGIGRIFFEKANPSGLPEYAESRGVPLRFPEGEPMTLKVFFSNTVKDPGMLQCETVYPVERTIVKTPAVARSALELLLLGPLGLETIQGFRGLIPEGTRLNSIRIEGNTAFVDFTQELNTVAGSCQVTAISAQIEKTLLQFSTVEDVVISINGQTEEILQP